MKKTNACIIYLSRSTLDDISNLKRSLLLLDWHFNNRFRYSVIVFHEDFNEDLIQDIRKSTQSQVEFEKIKFEIPNFLNKDEIPKELVTSWRSFPIGYRHMCRLLTSLFLISPLRFFPF